MRPKVRGDPLRRGRNGRERWLPFCAGAGTVGYPLGIAITDDWAVCGRRSN